MKLLARLWPFGRKAEGPLTTSEQIWLSIYGGQPSKSGAKVNHWTAIQVMAVLACMRVISEDVAGLPLKLHRRLARGREEVPDHPVALLMRRPNRWMTGFEWRAMMTAHAVLAGNAFSLIVKVRGGTQAAELIPIVPARVEIRQGPDLETVEYIVRSEDGSKPPVLVPADRMFHLRGPAWNGVQGLDIVRLAREAIGLALATEEHVAKLHANGTRTGGILATEQPLTDVAVANIIESWNKQFAGSENAFKTAILHSGLKWTSMAMSGADAETLAERRFQIEEICRAFRVNPLMVMQADKTATYASAEQFFMAHARNTLGPWVERWEEVLDRQVLGDTESDAGLFLKFNLNGLMRGDAQSRANFYSRGILDGWLTRNEARELEDMNPLEGLDLPLAPLNMADGTKPPAPPEPKPKPGGEEKPAKSRRRGKLTKGSDGSFSIDIEGD